MHFEDKRGKVFKGVGQTLGGETRPSRLVPSNLEDKSTDTQEPAEPKIETTSQLPGKLWETKRYMSSFLCTTDVFEHSKLKYCCTLK